MTSDEHVKGKGFEILDHTPPESKEGEAAPEAAEASQTAGTTEAPHRIDVYVVLQLFIRELGEVAWQKMGLRPNPFTNQIEKDIEQAHVAIDACGALVEKLLPHLQGQEAKDLQALLTDLRLNFVKQSE